MGSAGRDAEGRGGTGARESDAGEGRRDGDRRRRTGRPDDRPNDGREGRTGAGRGNGRAAADTGRLHLGGRRAPGGGPRETSSRAADPGGDPGGRD